MEVPPWVFFILCERCSKAEEKTLYSPQPTTLNPIPYRGEIQKESLKLKVKSLNLLDIKSKYLVEELCLLHPKTLVNKHKNKCKNRNVDKSKSTTGFQFFFVFLWLLKLHNGSSISSLWDTKSTELGKGVGLTLITVDSKPSPPGLIEVPWWWISLSSSSLRRCM